MTVTSISVQMNNMDKIVEVWKEYQAISCGTSFPERDHKEFLDGIYALQTVLGRRVLRRHFDGWR